jgi:hypothetical protein
MILGVDEHGRIAVFEDRPAGAAHSMDTDWYAVDRGGRVALLRSGEEGAVPYDAHRQYWAELYDELAVARVVAIASAAGEPFSERAALERLRAAARDPVEIALLTAILAGDDPSRAIYSDWLEAQGRARDGWTPRERTVFAVGEESRAIDPASLPWEWNGIVRFASREYLELFAAEYYHPEWRELEPRLGLPDAVAITAVQQYAFDEYWRAGAIASAYVIEQAALPHHIGLYEYGCSFNGPYLRRAEPRTPLLVEHLPEPLRGAVGGLRMARVDFHVTTSLDPEAFFTCQRYGE